MPLQDILRATFGLLTYEDTAFIQTESDEMYEVLLKTNKGPESSFRFICDSGTRGAIEITETDEGGRVFKYTFIADGPITYFQVEPTNTAVFFNRAEVQKLDQTA